jgi:putative capsular polysaccharide synthesis protein
MSGSILPAPNSRAQTRRGWLEWRVARSLARAYRQVFPRYGVRDPILVFQMGKVGSSTVYESLLALHLNVPVYHCHLLNNLDAIETEVRRAYPNPEETLRELANGRRLRKEIDGGRWKRWNIISLVREPVGRNVSAFFQNLTELIPDAAARAANHSLGSGEILQTFLQRYSHGAPAHWFDSQLKAVFGVDVFASAFPFEAGYQIYQGARARVLVMRLENLNDCLSLAVRDHLGIAPFAPIQANVGENKEYGDLYREFKGAGLPRDYVQQMYSTRFARHFYSPAELERFSTNWTGQVR